MLLRTEWAQNLLVRKASSWLSNALKTRVEVKRVSFSLFNRAYLEGALIEDRQQDTLLYAGALKLAITDWFFLQRQAEIRYLGLENAVVHLKREDSVWNYQFLADYFSGPPSSKPKESLELFLDRVDLRRILLKKEDKWLGEDMTVKLGALSMDADEFNLSRKKIFIESLIIREPSFSIRNYDGLRPPRPKAVRNPREPDTELQWNPENWDMLVKKLQITDGYFSNDRDTKRAPFPYFDGNHLAFSQIKATMTDLSWQQDTITASIQVSARERSGFKVDELKAAFTMHPEAMIFDQLDIRTPYSRVGNYYAMRFSDFNADMSDFLDKVRLEGRFRNSRLSMKDIAFFAPEMKDINRDLQVSGIVTGVISDISGRNLQIEFGKDSRFLGGARLTGLPDIETTRIQVEAQRLETSYNDAASLYPEIKKITNPDLASLGFVRFRGNYSGTIRQFRTNGYLQTALGDANADITLQLPRGKEPVYEGRISTSSFDLGRFLAIPNAGNIRFDGKFSGRGMDASKGQAVVDGTVQSFTWNGYTYSSVTLNGILRNRQFEGKAFVNDPNLVASLDGTLNFQSDVPEYNVYLDIQRGNLMNINLLKEDIRVLGKFRLNFTGKTIDDFLGEASLYDVSMTRNDQLYVFDTLYLYSMKDNDRKQIEITGANVHLMLYGIFNIRQLPETINSYLSKYYPMYFKASEKPIPAQDFTFSAELSSIEQYLPILSNKLRGFTNSSIKGRINTIERSMELDANIPYAAFGSAELNNFKLESRGDHDSLSTHASAGYIIFNDSLRFPASSLGIRSSSDLTDLELSTSSNQGLKEAYLSASVKNLRDGIRVHFRPSTVVLNEKTWRIENDGELTYSKSMIDAQNFRMTNGEQQITVHALPSEIGNTNDLIVSLSRVNLGDLLPFVLNEPRIEGITSGDITIEDPLGKMRIYLNAQTDQTRFEGDSIGITTLNAFWDNAERKSNFFLESNNHEYRLNARGDLDLKDSLNKRIDLDIQLDEVRLAILSKYLDLVFSDIQGLANGHLKVSGNLREPDLLGKVKVRNGNLKVAYTQCRYTLDNPEIVFGPDLIDFGSIRIVDELGNEGQIKGTLGHHFFRDFTYDFSASSKRLLALNTTKLDNSLFYGRAIAKMNFLFRGPEKQMEMTVVGEPVDSSVMFIATGSTSKQKGDVPYIIWRQYGREMNLDSLTKPSSNLSIDLDFTATPLLKANVVLDELTGDIISATGSGNIKIHTGTAEETSLNGRYLIEQGNYNFNFQDIFKKPFRLEPESGSFISWTGNPYNADINVIATYTAEKVRMSTLFEDPSNGTISGVSSDVLKELSDVVVNCKLVGTLSEPNPSFEIVMPASSPVRNNASVDTRLKTINRDQLEASKQATYLIVFRSFAPQAALAATDLNNELINSTISGVITSILSSSVEGFFSKILGAGVDVNFNYSRVLTNLTGDASGGTTSTTSGYRENVSFEFIKSFMNNKLVFTVGSDFNFAASSAAQSASNQQFLFLPDVNVEYKITPDGKFRTTFFYRSSYDALSSSGRRDRTGGNISYRTEFNSLIPWKKSRQALNAGDSTTSANFRQP